MSFWKRNTALPFIMLLVILIFLVTWSDRLADDISTQPRKVMLRDNQGNEDLEMLWQFEQATDDSKPDTDFKNDSLYSAGVNAYKSGKINRSETYFITLLNKYPESAEVLNYLGLISLKKNQLLDAEKRFDLALDRDSGYVPAYINLGLLYTQLENYSKSDSVYERAAELAPVNAKPLLNKGIMHCRIGEWEEANAALERAAELSSGDSRSKALTYLGMSRFNLGDTIQARQNFEEAINLSPSRVLPRIYLALSQADLQIAEEELRKVIALRPSYAPAHYYLGVVLQRTGKVDEAGLSYERALRLNPADKDITHLLGSFYIENELLDQAEQYFEEVYKQDTLSPQKFFFRAKIASRNEDPDTAIDLYDQAIERSGGNYAEAHLNKAILLKRRGLIDEAISEYRKAISLRANYEEAWYNLALAYRSIGDDNNTIECYEKAISINPKQTKAMYNLAFVYMDQDKTDRAIDLWENIIRIDPEYVKAWYNLGLQYYRSKRYEEAERTYNAMLERFPGYAKAWYNLALTQKENKKEAAAIASYENAIDLDPSYVNAWKNLGVLNAERGNLVEAINQFKQAIELDSTDPELRFNLALQYEKNSQLSEATLQLNKAIQLDPEYLKAILKLNEIAIQNGDKLQELRSAEMLRDLDGDPELSYELGREYHKADRYKDAIRVYDKSISYGKDGPWVLYWKAKAYEESGDIASAKNGYKAALSIEDDHKFSLYRLYLITSDQNTEESRQYKNELLNLYPEFSAEKKIQ